MKKPEKKPDEAQAALNVEDVEILKIYFEEFKYRHDLFWKVFFFLNTAIFFVIAIPFLYADKLSFGRNATLAYSILVLLLIVFSLYTLFNELARTRWTLEKLNKLRGDRERFSNVGNNEWYTRNYGKFLVAAFGVFFMGLLVIALTNPPNLPAPAPVTPCCVVESKP